MPDGNQADDHGAPETSFSKNKWKLIEPLLPAALGILVLAISVIAAIYPSLTTPKQLTVVGSLTPVQAAEQAPAGATEKTPPPNAEQTKIGGRVLQDGAPTDKAQVWAIVTYTNGQHVAPPSTLSDEKGTFTLGPVPNAVGTPCSSGNATGTNGSAKTCSIGEARIFARKEVPAFYFSKTVLSVEDRVRPEGTKEPLKLPFQWLLPLPAIFLVSAMLPFFGEPTHKKYLGAICLAFVFTGLMIFYLGYGLRYVYTAGTSQDVLALGFANIYQGTYVKDVPQEWLFSFTAPPVKAPTLAGSDAKTSADNAGGAAGETQTAGSSTNDSPTTGPPAGSKPSGTGAATKSAGGAAQAQAASSDQPKTNSTDTPPLDSGFGAPLWVLLISVLGAGVLTVSMIVEEITQISEVSKKPLPDQPGEIRKHLQTLVQHQFFILFAPITAIFVYQIMIAGSAAKSSFTVALTALGAGPSLSALLTKAGAAAAKALAGSKS